MLADENGCFAFNTNKQPVVLPSTNQALDDEGCFKDSEQCLAMLNPSDSMIKNAEYISSTLLAIELGEDDFKKNPRSYVYDNSLEDVKNPERGATGIGDWEYAESFRKPETCP